MSGEKLENQNAELLRRDKGDHLRRHQRQQSLQLSGLTVIAEICRKVLHTLLRKISRTAQGIGNIEILTTGMVIANGICIMDQASAEQVVTLNEFWEVRGGFSRQVALATAGASAILAIASSE